MRMMASSFQYQLVLAVLWAAALSKSEPISALSDVERNQNYQDEAQPQKALSAEQWTRKYWCDLAPANSSLVQSSSYRKSLIDDRGWMERFWYRMMHECNRDQGAWWAQYIDELIVRFKVLVADASIDERLANQFATLSFRTPLDYSYFQFNSGNAKEDRDNRQRVAGPSVNDSQCELDLDEMVGQLDELDERLGQIRANSGGALKLENRHIKMAQLLDAYGRYESGMLSGHTRSMGSYDQCIKAVVERRRSDAGQVEDIGMRFCWAKISLNKHLNLLIGQRQRQAHESSDGTFPVAACLPKSCHSKNLNSASNKRLVKKLLDSQLSFPSSIYLDQNQHLDSVFCLPDDDAVNFNLPPGGKLWIAFTTSWIIICCLATYLNIGESDSDNPNKISTVAGGAEPRHSKEIPSLELQILQQGQLMRHDVTRLDRLPRFYTIETEEKELNSTMHDGQQHQVEVCCLRWTKIGKCFNLRLSWKLFSSGRVELDPTAPVDLDMLNPIKVFACFYAIATHAVLMHALTSDHIIEVASQIERDRAIQAAILFSVFTDTLIVISGLLIGYISCRRIKRMIGTRKGKKRPSKGGLHERAVPYGRRSWSLHGSLEFLGCWFVLAANRYLRLVPLLAFIFYFRRDVLTYLGSGPLWDFGFNKDTMTGACTRSSSLVPFTFESLNTPLNKQCILTAWSVSNDILFGLLIPPFLLLIHKRPKLGLSAIYATLLACSIYGLQIWAEEPNPDRFEMSEMRINGLVLVFSSLSRIYTTYVIRGTDFLIGAIAGYALFKYAERHGTSKQSGKDEPHWPSWLTGTATKLSTFYLVLHFGVALFQLEIRALIYPYQRLYLTYLMTFDRTLWSAANAVLFLRIMTDWRHGAWLSKFADRKWKLLARLNYPLLLVHWIVILVQMHIGISLPPYTLWGLFSSLSAVLMASLPLSVFVHVVFENPLDLLIKKQIFGI